MAQGLSSIICYNLVTEEAKSTAQFEFMMPPRWWLSATSWGCSMFQGLGCSPPTCIFIIVEGPNE